MNAAENNTRAAHNAGQLRQKPPHAIARHRCMRMGNRSRAATAVTPRPTGSVMRGWTVAVRVMRHVGIGELPHRHHHGRDRRCTGPVCCRHGRGAIQECRGLRRLRPCPMAGALLEALKASQGLRGVRRAWKILRHIRVEIQRMVAVAGGLGAPCRLEDLCPGKSSTVIHR